MFKIGSLALVCLGFTSSAQATLPTLNEARRASTTWAELHTPRAAPYPSYLQRRIRCHTERGLGRVSCTVPNCELYPTLYRVHGKFVCVETPVWATELIVTGRSPHLLVQRNGEVCEDGTETCQDRIGGD